MIFAAGLAVVSGLAQGQAAAQKGVNEARRIRAQNKARIKQMQDQFALSTQNVHNNEFAIAKQRMKNDVAIEESKLDAQDAFAQAFAGSGVSGRSVDVAEASMQNEVAKAHNESAEQAGDASDRQFLGLMRQSDSIAKQVKDMQGFDVGANEANITMAGVSSAVSTFASAYSGGGLDSITGMFKGEATSAAASGGSSFGGSVKGIGNRIA